MKQRSESHIVNDKGIAILRNLLPIEWVHREYRPDYGVDFDVEIFDYQDTGSLVTLGEHFFVQLKSRSDFKTINRKVNARYNVEKEPLRTNANESTNIEVIPVQVESSTLELAQSMGPSVPLLLFACDVVKETIHFVCLNDYVDKIFVPEVADFESQDTYTVYVPVANEVTNSAEHLIPLRFFARRAKLYAAFNRFRYQQHELKYLFMSLEGKSIDEVVASRELVTIQHFISIAISYDFWNNTYAWPAFGVNYQHLLHIDKCISEINDEKTLLETYSKRIVDFDSLADKLAACQYLFITDIKVTWDRLSLCGNMFEEICREWYLPTYFGSCAEETAYRKSDTPI